MATLRTASIVALTNGERAIVLMVEPTTETAMLVQPEALGTSIGLTPTRVPIHKLTLVGRVRGLSRIDQPARRTYGWFARAGYEGKNLRFRKFFSDRKHGGMIPALLKALDVLAVELGADPLPVEKAERESSGHTR